MTNPLLSVWLRFLTESRRGHVSDEDDSLPDVVTSHPSAGILLVLRRMRLPLIVLILVFAVSVLGLSLIPGQDERGHAARMSLFEAFYFMSFTATTIGFGELPQTFTPAQRMWVTVVIFLSVISWAYAVGSLLALMQDRAFRAALARRHIARKVRRLGEPFVLIVGYGRAAKRVAHSLDSMGRRFVVIDRDESRVSQVDLDTYRADTPALLGNARDTERLGLAGLGHPHCEGVVALAGDDEVNLDVTMTTALLRPGLPVIARANSRAVAQRMGSFGAPDVVNPYDRFGDHLRILIRSPASYQLMTWLTSAPGTPISPRHDPLPVGPWVVCGQEPLVHELVSDLRAEGIEARSVLGEGGAEGRDVRLDRSSVDTSDLDDAAVFVAATRSDTTNLWLVDAARRRRPDIVVVALQNHTANRTLFESVDVSFGLVPDELVAHEVLARLANPMLMDFLPHVPHQTEAWSAHVLERLVHRCGHLTPDLWQVGFTPDEAPALTTRLSEEGVRLGDLLRSPVGRDRPLDAVVLVLRRSGSTLVAPEDDEGVWLGDRLLVAATQGARRALDATMAHEPTAAYVLEGRFVPSSWVWRRLSRSAPTGSR